MVQNSFKENWGILAVAQQLMNPTRIHENAGLIPGPIQWLEDMLLLWAPLWVADVAQILCCCGCGVGQQLQLQFNP